MFCDHMDCSTRGEKMVAVAVVVAAAAAAAAAAGVEFVDHFAATGVRPKS